VAHFKSGKGLIEAKAFEVSTDMQSHRRKVNCTKHGTKDYCIICQHLGSEAGLGYYACKATAEDPAQAWCEACDRVLEQERGWNDLADAAADWKLFCEGCYSDALGENRFIAWSVGTDDTADYETS
jgi:hypothetical protein